MSEALVTQEEIKTQREHYRAIAKRGSRLFFAITDLSLIDPMYQYSLDYFLTIFKINLFTFFFFFVNLLKKKKLIIYLYNYIGII